MLRHRFNQMHFSGVVLIGQLKHNACQCNAYVMVQIYGFWCNLVHEKINGLNCISFVQMWTSVAPHPVSTFVSTRPVPSLVAVKMGTVCNKMAYLANVNGIFFIVFCIYL